MAFGFRRAQCGEARSLSYKKTRPGKNCQAEVFTDYPPANAGVNEIKL